jgi:hypothetical protein
MFFICVMELYSSHLYKGGMRCDLHTRRESDNPSLGTSTVRQIAQNTPLIMPFAALAFDVPIFREGNFMVHYVRSCVIGVAA